MTVKPTTENTISIAKQARKLKVLLDDDAEDVEKTKKAIFSYISGMMARGASDLRRVVPVVKMSTTKKPEDTDKKDVATAKSKVSNDKDPTTETKSTPKSFIVAKNPNESHNKFASSLAKNAENSDKAAIMKPRTTFKSTTSKGKQATKLKVLFKDDAENLEETKKSYLSDMVARDASDQGRSVPVIPKSTTTKPEVTTKSATVPKKKDEKTTKVPKVKNATTAVVSTKLFKNTTKSSFVPKKHIVLPAYLYI